MIPLQTVDLSSSGVTRGQYLLAAAVLVVLAGVLTIVAYRLQYAGLSDDLRRQKEALMGQREAASPTTYRIDSLDELATARPTLGRLFDGDSEVSNQTSTLRAVHETWRALVTSWHEATSSVPSLVLFLLEEAVIIGVLGALAVESPATFEAWFAGGGGFDLQTLAADAVTLTSTIVTTGLDVVATFPYLGALVSVAFSVGVLAATVWFDVWWLVAPLLLVLAGVVYWSGEQASEEEAANAPLADHSYVGLAGRGILFAASVWVVGVIPAAGGRALGVPQAGAIIGLLFAVVAVLAGVVWVAFDAVAWVRANLRGQLALPASGETGGGEAVAERVRAVSLPTAVYWVARPTAALLVATGVPLAVAYAAVVVSQGKLWAAWAAFQSGSPAIQALVVGVVATVLVGIGLQTRAAWPTIRAALRDTLSQRAVRTAVFGRALPWTLAVLGLVVARAFGFPWLVAVPVGLAVAAVARLLFEGFQRAKYHVGQRETADMGVGRVLVRASVFHDADGDPIYYARVNSRAVAHRDREAAVDAIVAVGEQLFADGTVEPSLATAFADDLFRFGIVDVEETRQRLRRRTQERTKEALRDEHGMATVETVEERLEAIPEDVWRSELREWRYHGDLRERDGYYILNV